MIKQLKHTILYGNKHAALHIHFIPQDKVELFLTVLEKKGDEIHPVSHNSLKSIDELPSLLKKNVPVILSLTGKGIISKQVILNEGKSALHALFPNAEEEEFEVRSMVCSNGEHYISAVRKAMYTNLETKLDTLGYSIVSIAVGITAVQSLAAILTNTTFFLDTKKVIIADNKIQSVENCSTQPEETALSVGSDSIPDKYILSFSTALYFWTHIIYSKSKLFSEIIYRRLIKLLSIAVISLLLALLLGNYFLFSHYYSKEKQLESQLQADRELLSEVSRLKEELHIKESLMQQTNFRKGTHFSAYADMIAKTVPRKMILQSLSCNIPEGKIKSKKQIIFTQDNIIIKGSVANSGILDDWVKILKKYDWIEKVEILQYSRSSKFSNGDFELQITIAS